MFKFYSLTQADFDAQVRNANLPPQQKQIYAALAHLGRPVRGQDAVTHAVKEFGLVTRQPHDRLAAWYFSDKRSYMVPGLKWSNDAAPATPAAPTGPSEPVFAE